MKVQWSERPSGAHHSQHLVSGRQLQNVKLVVYSTTVPATLYFFSTTFIQRLEILCRLRLLRVDWLLLLICDQSDMLWAGLSERMLHHILRLTTKRNKKTLMLIIENILILISAFFGPSLIIRTTADQCFLSQKYTNTLSGYRTCTTWNRPVPQLCSV